MDVDLHIHSTASDGSFSPNDILARARYLKLKAIAITDHDTVDGARSIMAPEKTNGLHVLSGVEISSTPPDHYGISGNFHILGYGMRLSDPVLDKTLQQVRQSRNKRNPQIISRLISLGMDISMEDVNHSSEGEVVGRPHIARALMQKGYVSTIDEAFDRFLAKGQSCFVEKHRLDCRTALAVIRQAGGLPVLAHPVSLGTDMKALEALLVLLKKWGLCGLEAYYSDHGPDEIDAYCFLADQLGLVVTGGSDFHGEFKSDIDMGRGKGSLDIPFRVYEDIMDHMERITRSH